MADESKDFLTAQPGCPHQAIPLPLFKTTLLSVVSGRLQDFGKMEETPWYSEWAIVTCWQGLDNGLHDGV
jgi:hypothetical protein